MELLRCLLRRKQEHKIEFRPEVEHKKATPRPARVPSDCSDNGTPDALTPQPPASQRETEETDETEETEDRRDRRDKLTS